MILSCNSIQQTYTQGNITLNILNDVNFEITEKQVVALVGPSGSGKSTLLHILGLLEKPQSGTLQIANHHINLTQFSDQECTNIRKTHIGFVYQFHHLLPQFSALENVMMPLILNGYTKGKAIEHAEKALDKVGLSQRKNHMPKQLSGGEQQRTAIARALIHNPSLILADEPTGNLDYDTAKFVFNEMINLIQEHNMGALIATHDLELAQKMNRRFFLSNGNLIEKQEAMTGFSE